MSKQNLIKQLITDSQKLPLESVRQILADELSTPPEEMDTKLVELCVKTIEEAEKGQKLKNLLKSKSARFPAEDIREILQSELEKPEQEMDTALVDLCAEAIEKAEKEQKLVDLFKSKSVRLPAEDIREILKSELEKPAQEMDTALVDLCAEAIGKSPEPPEETTENSPEDNEKKQPKKRNGKKFFLLAAIVAALLAAFLPSFASRIKMRASNEIVSIDADGNYTVDLSKISTVALLSSSVKLPFVKMLCDEGIDDPVLPEELLDEKLVFKIVNTGEENGSYVVRARFGYRENELNGYIRISKADSGLVSGKTNINATFDNVKQIRFNGLDALLFSGNGSKAMYYVNGRTEYFILLAEMT